MRHTVVIASGPSLTEADCDRVARWREADAHRRVIVVNNSCFIAPWADTCYSADYDWFDVYYARARAVFAGEFVTANENVPDRWPELVRINRLTGTHIRGKSIAQGGSNGSSGFQALCLAIVRGAHRVTLLGFDCQHDGARTHFDGDHEPPLGNAVRPELWLPAFDDLALQSQHRGVVVVNATRRTALRAFPQLELEKSLAY